MTAEKPPVKILAWAILWFILKVMLIEWQESYRITKPTFGGVCEILPETIRPGVLCYNQDMVESWRLGLAGGSRSQGTGPWVLPCLNPTVCFLSAARC